MESKGRASRTAVELSTWLLLFLAARLLTFLIESASVHSLDELYAGAVAVELGAGRGLDCWLMSHVSYCGGPVILAAIVQPLFASLGETTFALRLPSLLAATAGFAFWLDTARRLFGVRAARFTAALFVLSPPFYAATTIVAWANHAESTVPAAAAVWLLVRALATDGRLSADPRPWQRLQLALSGAAAGAALLFSYGALVYGASLGLVLAALGRRAWLRLLPWFAAGAAVGALPALLHRFAWQAAGHASGLDRLAAPDPGHVLTRLLGLGLDLRWYLAAHTGFGKLVDSLLWAACGVAVAAALWTVARGVRPGRALPGDAVLVLPPLGFAAVFAVSTFPMGPRSLGFLGYRYLSLITPCLLVVLAAWLAHRRRLGPALAVAVLLPNAVAALTRLPDASTAGFRLRGASYAAYGAKVMETLHYDLEPSLAVVAPIDDEVARRAALRGVATRHLPFALDRLTGSQAERVAEFVVAGLPAAPEARAVWLQWTAWLLQVPGRLALAEGELGPLLDRLGRAPRDDGLGGIAAVAVLAADRIPAAAEFEELPPELRAGGYRGLGMLAARREQAGRARLTAPDEPERRAPFLFGYGMERARHLLMVGEPASELVVAAVDRDAVAAGVRRALAMFEPEDGYRRRLVAARCGLGRLGSGRRDLGDPGLGDLSLDPAQGAGR